MTHDASPMLPAALPSATYSKVSTETIVLSTRRAASVAIGMWQTVDFDENRVRTERDERAA